MNKKKLLIIIISSVVALITAVTLILVFTLGNKGGGNGNGYIDSARSIKVVQIDGSATVNDGEKDLTCFRGMNLYSGDKVCVSDDSVLVIRFDADKYIYLGENTKINIKSEGKDRYKTNVYVEEGKVLAEIQNKLGEDEEFFLSSNNSVMAVRGTVFGVEVKKVGTEIHQTYSVFRGVTELVVFDKKGGEVIQGKLTDISDSKIEITVPVDEALSEEEFNGLVDNLFKKNEQEKVNEFENPEDANEKLNEVEIVVGKPSKEDYQEVIDTVSGDSNVTYSAIVYNSEGYFGGYDGNPHKISINVENPKAKVYYKGENDNDYKEENTYEYTLPGTYRVYYKIVCEGFDDKEDFEVIQISKSNLSIEYTKNLIPDKLLLDGMSLEYALSGIDLKEYISITGAEADMDSISNITFDITGILRTNVSTYKIPLILPDDIKPFYNDAHVDLTLEVIPLTIYSSNAITLNEGYPFVNINSIESFNKYNGVDEESLFGNMEFIAGNSIINSEEYENIEFAYSYITQNFYELKEGLNTVDATIAFDDYSITTTLKFYYNESRFKPDLTVNFDNGIVTKLSDNNYWFMPADMNSNETEYIIPGYYLLEYFGLNEECYINLPTDFLDENSANYTKDESFNFKKDSISKIEFLIMQNSSTRSSSITIYVYFSMSEPDNYPTYTLGNTTYRINSEMDFIESDYPVLYSLDGINYSETLTINSYGKHTVYFKVGSEIILESSQEVIVEKSVITSDNLNMLSSQINLLSTDGHDYSTVVEYGEGSTVVTVTGSDGSTVSPLIDVYTVYTNMLMNSKYYDSMTKEEINVVVSYSPFEEDSASFSYNLVAEGYDIVYGTVNFVYAPKTGLIISGKYTESASISNPADLTLNINDIDEVFASIPSISMEDDFTSHSVIFSIDGGKTWTSDVPSFTTVGTYEVYSIYTYTVSTDTSIVVSIQTITLTE